ncbi:MAG: DUF4198 domain-containing protein [Pseudomonadota bacterium]
MHNTLKKLRIFGLSVILMIVLFVMPASAHFTWINVEKYTLPANSELSLNIGHGHSFGNPVGNVLFDHQQLEEMVLIAPDGEKIKVAPANAVDFKGEGPLKKEGAYLAVAKKIEGFFSKTTDGYKKASKKELKNAIECSYSGGSCKAIINSGKGGGDAYSKALGHTLEIVPLKNPADLKQGDYMLIKVLYKGEALRTDIFATFVGFSTEGAWAYTTGINKEGIGQVKILHPGVWLIKVSHKEPYPDPKECDQYSYTATLTFEVK